MTTKITNKQSLGNYKVPPKVSKNKKEIELVFFYDSNGKQISVGDYCTSNNGVGNMYSYNRISKMSDQELTQIQVRKEIKRISYTEDKPKPQPQKSFFDTVIEFFGF